MISRRWKGIAKREQADRYIAHLKSDTFPKLASQHAAFDRRTLRVAAPAAAGDRVVGRM